jgi:hypothetical protein
MKTYKLSKEIYSHKDFKEVINSPTFSDKIVCRAKIFELGDEDGFDVFREDKPKVPYIMDECIDVAPSKVHCDFGAVYVIYNHFGEKTILPKTLFEAIHEEVND